MRPRLSDDILYLILKKKLKENIYRNRGYILDGYPRFYADSEGSFFDIIEDPQDGQEPKSLNQEILPNNVIILEGCDDQFLKERMKLMPEEKLRGTHYNEAALKKRLNTYHSKNESLKGDLSLRDFFESVNVANLTLDCRNSEEELINKMKIFFERKGKINNYMTDDYKVLEQKSKVLKETIDKINGEKQKDNEE